VAEAHHPTIRLMHVRTDFSLKNPEWDEIEAQWMNELAVGGPGGRNALTRLFKVYGKLFERRLHRMGMRQQAEDIAQGLWLEISRAAPRYRGEMPVRVFLLGFLKMACRRFFSELGKEPKELELDEQRDGQEDDTPMVFAPPVSTASKAGVEWFDFRRCVRRALAKFEERNPGMHKLLLLRHVEELSLDEMAEELGGSANRAKGEVFAARRKFSPLIEPCLKLWPDRARSAR